MNAPPSHGRGDAREAGRLHVDPADRPYIDYESEPFSESWGARTGGLSAAGMVRIIVAVVFMAAAAGGLWYAYSKGKASAGGGVVPLIKADQTDMKVKPDNPGGVREDGDTPVYSATNGVHVEQLLPPAETPLPKPQPDALPPNTVATTSPDQTASAPPAVAATPAPPLSNESAPAQTTALPSPPTAPAPAPVAAAMTPSASVPAPEAADDAADHDSAANAPIPLKPAPVVPPPTAAPVETKDAAGVASFRVQIASTRDMTAAKSEWKRMKAAHADALGDLNAFGVRADLGAKGIYYRIQAGPITDRADALRRCAILRKFNIGCIIVKHP